MTKPFPAAVRVKATALLEADFPSRILSQVNPALPVMDRDSFPDVSLASLASMLAVSDTKFPLNGRRLNRTPAPAVDGLIHGFVA